KLLRSGKSRTKSSIPSRSVLTFLCRGLSGLQNEIIRRQNPGHRIAKDGEISSRLWQAFVHTIQHVSAHHPQTTAAPLRKSFEPLGCGSDAIGVHRENLKRAVLPLDNPIQRRSSCLRDMKKN